VVALIGSADGDERCVPDPDRFDLERDSQGHIAFGFGRHFCLGASLVRRLVHMRLFSAPEYVDSFLVRGPRALEVAARSF
jgi:hypothetical protein